MPLFLIQFVTWLGGAAFSAAVWFVTRKGILFTAMSGLIALVGLAIAALVSQADTLMGAIIPESLGFVTPFIPGNLSLCISTVISTELACTVYALAIKFIDMKSRVLLA